MSKLPHNGNFTIILPSRQEIIGPEQRVWRASFRTAGRRTDTPALLKLGIHGMRRAREDAEVAINGEVVGGIGNYFGLEGESGWYTQVLSFDSRVLDPDGDNEIRIKAVHDGLVKPLVGGPPLDEFRVKDIVCFYHCNGETAFDYKVIHGDSPVLLGEGSGAENLWRDEFGVHRIGKRDFAYLLMNTRGLTESARDVDVRINGQVVGDIDDYEGQDDSSWFTQMVPFDPGLLREGANALEIEAVGMAGTFSLRNIACVYQEVTPRRKSQPTVLGFIPLAVDQGGESIAVGDFAWVTDSPVRIGDRGEIVWEESFLTGNRIANDTAYLLFSVKGLTLSEHEPAVKINNRVVGRITRYPGGGSEHWHTQSISFDAGVLNDGANRIEIEAAALPDTTSENFDDFWVRGMTCWFHRVFR